MFLLLSLLLACSACFDAKDSAADDSAVPEDSAK